MIAQNKLKDIQFSSDFNYERFKEAKSRTWSVGAWGQSTFSISHGLGYVPFFRLYIQFPSGRIYLGANGGNTYELSTGAQCDYIYADNNNIYVTMSENNGAGTISGNMYCDIYLERIN